MRRFFFGALLAVGVVPMAAGAVQAQEPSDFLAVGEMAPEIVLTGATRHGVLAEPVTLSALRGETVVLAFFFRARTRG